jgi:hypothetical protein
MDGKGSRAGNKSENLPVCALCCVVLAIGTTALSLGFWAGELSGRLSFDWDLILNKPLLHTQERRLFLWTFLNLRETD